MAKRRERERSGRNRGERSEKPEIFATLKGGSKKVCSSSKLASQESLEFKRDRGARERTRIGPYDTPWLALTRKPTN
jgi:hypothetical protein